MLNLWLVRVLKKTMLCLGKQKTTGFIIGSSIQASKLLFASDNILTYQEHKHEHALLVANYWLSYLCIKSVVALVGLKKLVESSLGSQPLPRAAKKGIQVRTRVGGRIGGELEAVTAVGGRAASLVFASPIQCCNALLPSPQPVAFAHWECVLPSLWGRTEGRGESERVSTN